MVVSHAVLPPVTIGDETALPDDGIAAAETDVDVKKPVDEKFQNPAEADVVATVTDSPEPPSGEDDVVADASESPEPSSSEETREVKVVAEAVTEHVDTVTELATVVQAVTTAVAATVLPGEPVAAGELTSECWFAVGLTSCSCLRAGVIFRVVNRSLACHELPVHVSLVG